MAVCVVGALNAYHQSQKEQISDVALANIEALACGVEGNPGKEPAWWDFVNNKMEVEMIPVKTREDNSCYIEINGVEIGVSNQMHYSYAIYHWCYDSGSSNECTSSHLHEYI